jgi:chromosomal replication initiation ATPase DnaA
MTRLARQLVLELPHRPALGRDDFLVTPSNAAAVAMIDQWPGWPSHAVVLTGPPGSGKSHLAEVWRQRSGAARIDAGELREADVPALLAAGSLAVEDVPGRKLDEKALFHLLNYALQQGGKLLLTATAHPAQWHVGLPDLLSRLRALPVAELGPPDDALLRGVLVKLFTDRQLAVEEQLISYLMVRMPRSLEAARALVAEADRRALEEKAELTRSFVARVLGGLDAPGLFPEEN